VAATLSLDLHILQLVDNLVFVLNHLLNLSIFCLVDCFNKLSFKFVDALLELVEAAVDSFEVAS
jgi:hypothetical protein